MSTATLGLHLNDDQGAAAVLGIDPGKDLGLAVLIGADQPTPRLLTFSTTHVPQESSDAMRAELVSDALHHARYVTRQARAEIVGIGVERTFIGVNRNPSIVRRLIFGEGFTRGVAQKCGFGGLLVEDFTTSTIASTLESGQSKAERAEATKALFPSLESATEHEIDAVAVAYTLTRKIEW